jgi:hypothetical protein
MTEHGCIQAMRADFFHMPHSNSCPGYLLSHAAAHPHLQTLLIMWAHIQLRVEDIQTLLIMWAHIQLRVEDIQTFLIMRPHVQLRVEDI